MSETLAEIYARMVRVGSLKDDPGQSAAIPQLDTIKTHFETQKPSGGLLGGLFAKAPEPPPGVYLWGGVGRGKSMLMDLFVDAVDIPDKRRVHFHAFMQEVHAGLHSARQTGVDDALKPVADELTRDLTLLCLDEMQITDITDAMIVGRLFEALFAAGVVVVTTSNRVPDDLYKDGLNRQLFLPFIALLKDKLIVHELVSPTDYRQNRLSEEQVYFSPANAAARASIDAIWRDLTGAKTEPLKLTVHGREVVLSRYKAGMARAPFWELCGKPLGPADYLAISDALRLLILEDIPLLSRNNYNEARRFVTLIDALYEARVRLIATAADIPERLYVEGAGAFEFERTASRLMEMQSADWGV